MKYFVALISLLFTSMAFAQCQTQKINQTFQLMAERAQVMQQVAEYKFKTGGSVYDAQQEIHVLQQTKAIAQQQGITVDSLLVFSQLQMDLSKYIENYWMGYWQANPADRPANLSVINLTQMRQQISAIDQQLFPAIKASIPQFAQCSNQQLQQAMAKQFKAIKGIPDEPNYQHIMLQALENIRLLTA